jgi:outer membrane protein assembly factor BamD (BamD/ComL family)
MTRFQHRLLSLLLLLLAGAARAQEIDTLNKAIEDYNDAKNRPAAIGFYRVEEGSTVADNRFKAEYYLAQALNKLGLGFSSFFYYGQIIQAGPSHPYYFKAIEGAVAVSEAYRDEVLGPNVLNKAYNDQFGRLPPETLSKINYYIALLGYRAGKTAEAEQFLQGVPPESSAYARAQYLNGLLLQRKDPEKAIKSFKRILSFDAGKNRDLADLQELAHLALGRTYYAQRRFAEASAEYGKLPRFSRHWDEALFEGAYADLLNDDPGSALGKLHSLHSPHLSDEFAPESQNLTAIIYHQNCLYPQVREVIARFNREYVPMKEQMKAVLAANPPVETYWQMVASPADTRLPLAVQHHLQKNERLASMLGYLQRLDLETEKIRGDSELAQSALGADLLDLIVKQKALVGQVAGKFIKGRLADLTHLIEVLDGDKEIIGFETTKGEKEVLEQNVNVTGLLAGQKLYRPEMPVAGHEYWPFDGEYWPDEIGYYKYTLKNACPAKKKDE